MANDPAKRAQPLKPVVAQPIRRRQLKRQPGENSQPAPAANSGADAGGIDWENLIGAAPSVASNKAGATAKRRGHPAGRGRSKWILPISLLGVLAAGGFVGYAIYTFNKNQSPPVEVANSTGVARSHIEESISKGAVKPKADSPNAAPLAAKRSNDRPPGSDATRPLAPAVQNPNVAVPNQSSGDPDPDALASLLTTDPSKNPAPSNSRENPRAPSQATSDGNAKNGNVSKTHDSGKSSAGAAGQSSGTAEFYARSSGSPVTSSGAIVKPAVTPVKTAEAGDDELLELYGRKKLFAKTSYPTIRHIFAKRFEEKHQQEIKRAYGGDVSKMTQWLDGNPDIKEELYLAIDEKYNNVVEALSLFNQLRNRFPDKIEPYANLAIATAVTWDKSGKAVYDYLDQIDWTKSKLVGEQLNAAGNFAYFMAGERTVGDRLRLLPWEFLVHVVNHRTPLAERQWAATNYFSNRSMFGKCYKDVPYDMEALNSNFATAKLNGQEYSLENIRKFGGVCAQQADFATRVGKSIGVPAEYVRGESNSGELHAWVMWVELLNVTKTSIVFSLESYGRYSEDKYYVGDLTDPRTGQEITDRQLELSLQAVGADPIAHRQAALIMRAYPMFREKSKMTVADQLKFLEQAMKLSPWLEEPWLEVAKMSRDGLLGKEHAKQMLGILDRLFVTFAAVPDFTWKVFDDLITFQTVPKQRGKLYERLVSLYEQAGRPDLSCEARLKYVDYLVADNRYKEAIEGLAVTIKKFPDEGRYVPRMLDRLQEVCKKSNLPRTDGNLVLFYKEYLPMIPPLRGDRASPFCMQMYERGIAIFKSSGNTDLADLYTAQLAKLKAGKG